MPTRAAHILAHQIMALTIQHEGGVPVADWWAWISSATPFQGLTEADRASSSRTCSSEDILFESGGRLRLGARGRALYGWRNFSELYAVFSAPQTLTCSGAPSEIGYDRRRYSRSKSRSRHLSFVLGARPWRAVEINWNEGLIRVEPLQSGNLPAGRASPAFSAASCAKRCGES